MTLQIPEKSRRTEKLASDFFFGLLILNKKQKKSPINSSYQHYSILTLVLKRLKTKAKFDFCRSKYYPIPRIKTSFPLTFNVPNAN